MSGNKTASEDSRNALLHILDKSPPWLRALVLVAVLLTGISVAGTFIVAVISGRSVEFWPPKVGQYESPSVQQCKAIIDLAKEFEQGNNRRVEQLQGTMDKQITGLATMREKLVTESSSFSMGVYKAAENIASQEKEILDTTQAILGALKGLNDSFMAAQQKCSVQ
jgi:hypothetical protein